MAYNRDNNGSHQSNNRDDQAGGRPQVRRQFFRRRKTCPFSGANAMKIDYKDVRILSKFVSERGKIIPSRISAVSIKKTTRAFHCD